MWYEGKVMGTEVNHPDPKAHLLLSLLKSGIRIFGCGAAMVAAASNVQLAIVTLAFMMALAEGVGIVEELV